MKRAGNDTRRGDQVSAHNHGQGQKVVFLTPPVDPLDAFGSFCGVENRVAPLGICYLAAAAREKGFRTSIVDATTFKMTPDEALRAALRQEPDYIGITATSPALRSAGHLAEKLKKSNPHLPIIIGGVHVTNKPLQTLNDYPSFDIGVMGDGEEVLPRLLDCLSAERSLSSIKGIAYRCNDEVVLAEKMNIVADLDRLPFPAWDLLHDFPESYQPAPQYFYQLPSATLITSRGCPGKCIFCAKSINRRKVAYHSADYVLNMIEILTARFGVRDIFFFDDTFLFSKKRVIEICRGIIERGFKITWCCFCRGGEVDPELLEYMKRAGCYQISIGVESGDQQILDLLGKNIPLEKTTESIYRIHRAGIRVHGFFIIGSPGETESSLKTTSALIKKLPFSSIQLSFFSPLPGTAAEGMIQDYGKLQTSATASNLWEPVFIPSELDLNKMESYYKKILRDFYISPRHLLTYLCRVLFHPQHLFAYAQGGFAILKRLLAKKSGRGQSSPPASQRCA